MKVLYVEGRELSEIYTELRIISNNQGQDVPERTLGGFQLKIHHNNLPEKTLGIMTREAMTNFPARCLH